VPDPKVQQQAPALAPVVSRPLRTAASFVLVLPKRRVVYRHWDKETYLPGEEAELVLEGEGIGDQKYEFVVEKADSEDGPWEPVASLQAKVEGERASAKFKFPKAEPKGRLSKAEWKRASASPGDRLGLHVEAEGYEGGFLSIQVEKKQDDGSWDVYTRWQGTIEQGKYDGVFPVPPREGAGEASAVQLEGKIVELSFEQDPVEDGTAWMEARTENLDGSQLRFVLERADEVGTWVEVGSAVSTVNKGRARNSVAVPPPPSQATPESAPESPDPVRFAVARLHTHDQVVVSLDPGWLKGESYEVTLERRSLDGEGKWEPAGAVVEQPANGERVRHPSDSEPDATSGQESAADGPDEQGEAVRADQREPGAAETVQAAPRPGAAASPAAQAGAAQPAAQVPPAPATQASQAQPARPLETARAQRPVAPPASPAPSAPTSLPPQGRLAPDRPAPAVQAAAVAAVPEAQAAPAPPTLKAQASPPQTRQAQAVPAPPVAQAQHSPVIPAAVSEAPPSPATARPGRRPAISVQAPPDAPSLAIPPAGDAPPAPPSMSASVPVAPQASETLAPAVASGANSSGGAAAQVAAVAEAPSGGGRLPGAERVLQGPGSPSGDSLSDVLSKARDAKDKAKDARSKLEKAQEFANDLAPPDEDNVEE